MTKCLWTDYQIDIQKVNKYPNLTSPAQVKVRKWVIT